MKRRTRGALIALGVLLAASVGTAQQPQTVRIRGTIESVDGPTLTVKSRDGQTSYTVRLTADAAVRGIIPASLSDIKPNSYIGVTGMPQADGSQKAIAIHIFPEYLRGTGEGFRPWDRLPNSTMTNATVSQMVKGVDGEEITLVYKDGDKKVIVTPETVIVAYVRGERSELTPGAKVFIPAASRKEEGLYEAASISVGRDGLTPPM
jgi:Domain of unknown function (DUF5666)